MGLPGAQHRPAAQNGRASFADAMAEAAARAFPFPQLPTAHPPLPRNGGDAVLSNAGQSGPIPMAAPPPPPHATAPLPARASAGGEHLGGSLSAVTGGSLSAVPGLVASGGSLAAVPGMAPPAHVGGSLSAVPGMVPSAHHSCGHHNVGVSAPVFNSGRRSLGGLNAFTGSASSLPGRPTCSGVLPCSPPPPGPRGGCWWTSRSAPGNHPGSPR